MPPKMRALRIVIVALCFYALVAPAAQAELVLKLLVVNPSDTETKEFDIRNPLPPEVKPEHVLSADGLRVEYDSQAGTFMLLGTVTLKPKEALTKRVLLEDVWVIPDDKISTLRREIRDILEKLEHTAYEQQGRLMAAAIERKLSAVEESQHEPFASPSQHITKYREDTKQLALVESDLVSLRQLMVMAALRPDTSSGTASLQAADAGAVGESGGGLSARGTWQIILAVLGLLAFVSVSFFLLARRQLKLQLAKQAEAQAAAPEAASTILGGSSSTTPSTPRPPA